MFGNNTHLSTRNLSSIIQLQQPPQIPTLPIHGSPLPFYIRNIYGVGRNYADHALEMGGNTKERPFFFQKPTFGSVVHCSTTIPVDERNHLEQQSECNSSTMHPPPPVTIPYPPGTQELHFEVEWVVAVVASESIGGNRTYKYYSCVGVDLTRRDVQRNAKQKGRPWCTSKGGFYGAAPMGMLYPGTKNGNGISSTTIDTAELWLTVNGVERQRCRPVRDMTWSVEQLLEEAGKVLYDVPGGGDLFLTGTPAGVGVLQVGDVIRAGMDGCGEIAFQIGPVTT